MKDNWRAAIASLDGKVINEHFGRARTFYIVDITRDGSWHLVEKRDVVPLCSGGHHSREAMAAHIRTLGDCAAVLAAQVGPAARRALELNRISVFEQPDYIDSALAKLAEYYAKTNFTVPEE